MITRLGCEFDQRQDVALSEFTEPVLGMTLPPSAYLEVLGRPHALLLYRDNTYAAPVELTLGAFSEQAVLESWGPSSSLPNEGPCHYERLVLTAPFSIRRSDGEVLIGPGTTKIAISPDDVEEGVISDTVAVATTWLEEIGAPLGLPEYEAGSGYGWRNGDDPNSPIDFAGTVSAWDDQDNYITIAEFTSP